MHITKKQMKEILREAVGESLIRRFRRTEIALGLARSHMDAAETVYKRLCAQWRRANMKSEALGDLIRKREEKNYKKVIERWVRQGKLKRC